MDRLLILLEELNMTPYKMAKELNFSSGNFYQWKNGKLLPNINASIKIAKYFKVSLDWLFGRTEIREVGGNISNKEDMLLTILRQLPSDDALSIMAIAYEYYTKKFGHEPNIKELKAKEFVKKHGQNDSLKA